MPGGGGGGEREHSNWHRPQHVPWTLAGMFSRLFFSFFSLSLSPSPPPPLFFFPKYLLGGGGGGIICN